MSPACWSVSVDVYFLLKPSQVKVSPLSNFLLKKNIVCSLEKKAPRRLRCFLCTYFLSFGCCSVAPDLPNLLTGAEENSEGHTACYIIVHGNPLGS